MLSPTGKRCNPAFGRLTRFNAPLCAIRPLPHRMRCSFSQYAETVQPVPVDNHCRFPPSPFSVSARSAALCPLVSTFPFQLFSFVEVGTPVARCPPHRSRRAVFPHRALRAGTSSSLTGRLARLIRRSHGTGSQPWRARVLRVVVVMLALRESRQARPVCTSVETRGRAVKSNLLYGRRWSPSRGGPHRTASWRLW